MTTPFDAATAHPFTIVSAENLTYDPFIEANRVGYTVTHPDGRTERVFLVPSTDCGETEGRGNVFFYIASDSITDEYEFPITFIDMFVD